MVEDAAFVVGVLQFGAIRTGAAANLQKDLGRTEHAEGRRYEVDPQGMPIASMQR